MKFFKSFIKKPRNVYFSIVAMLTIVAGLASISFSYYIDESSTEGILKYNAIDNRLQSPDLVDGNVALAPHETKEIELYVMSNNSFMSQYNDIEIRIIRKIASIFCNKVIVLTKRSMDDYKRYFRIKSKKITFIYNWISDSIIDEYRKYNLESKIILTAGRFTKEKGYDLLLQVAEKVLPLNPEWQWHIYGEGPLEQEYYNKAVSLGLENSLIFKGFVNNMNDVYENASIYVLPSYREGIPLVLLEAKAYKIPCVSFDILTGPNEIIEDAKNGYLIKPYDIEAMAACINKMIINPDIRQELSNKSYSNINKFREINIYDQWVILINQLLSAW